jgi:hypothetical protein
VRVFCAHVLSLFYSLIFFSFTRARCWKIDKQKIKNNPQNSLKNFFEVDGKAVQTFIGFIGSGMEALPKMYEKALLKAPLEGAQEAPS